MTIKNEALTGKGDFSSCLFDAFGPLVGGQSLIKLLGYPNAQAFRQAYFRHTLPVSVFEIPHRRGKYAFTQDVAMWLTALRERKDIGMP